VVEAETAAGKLYTQSGVLRVKSAQPQGATEAILNQMRQSKMGHSLRHFSPICFLLLLTACGSNGGTTPTSGMTARQFINSLSSDGYVVAQGNVYLFSNSDCPLFVSIFNSCFGNNPAAPYIIPQPPIEHSYVDPYYAVQLTTPGPNGSQTNIAYRLGEEDALVTLVTYPPTGAYFGYQSYVFTSETSNYTRSDPLQVLSPDPSRYEIFGSVGNDVNNIIVQNQYGEPWGGRVVMYVTTSNQDVASDLMSRAKAKGIDPNSVFVEPLGSNVNVGNGRLADDLITLIRYAIPEHPSAGSDWLANVSSNVLVYKISSPSTSVKKFAPNQYTSRTGNAEITLEPQLDKLAGLLQTWLTARTPPPEVVATKRMNKTTEDSPEGIPHGLVGADCIRKGTICAGDNQDTSTYAFSSKITLSETDTLFVVGINHNLLNNASYISLDIYNARDASGVASSSQTKPEAVGFDSGVLTGSAEAVLRELGLYSTASDSLKAALPKLYVALVSKSCSVARTYCVSLDGDTLIPADVPINIYERSYINPGATTGADTNVMVYPNVVSAGFE
jgi:hypothetical protein